MAIRFCTPRCHRRDTTIPSRLQSPDRRCMHRRPADTGRLDSGEGTPYIAFYRRACGDAPPQYYSAHACATRYALPRKEQ